MQYNFGTPDHYPQDLNELPIDDAYRREYHESELVLPGCLWRALGALLLLSIGLLLLALFVTCPDDGPARGPKPSPTVGATVGNSASTLLTHDFYGHHPALYAPRPY